MKNTECRANTTGKIKRQNQFYGISNIEGNDSINWYQSFWFYQSSSSTKKLRKPTKIFRYQRFNRRIPQERRCLNQRGLAKSDRKTTAVNREISSETQPEGTIVRISYRVHLSLKRDTQGGQNKVSTTNWHPPI